MFEGEGQGSLASVSCQVIHRGERTTSDVDKEARTRTIRTSRSEGATKPDATSL